MFVHAESTEQTGSEECKDNDATLFMRLGTDFTENYYEYEIPLKMSKWFDNSEANVWPDANNIDILFDSLIAVKQRRNNRVAAGAAFTNEIYTEEDHTFAGRLIKVVGNPNLQGLKIVMIGVRNPHKDNDNPWKPDDGKDKCLEVWINELRLTDFDQHGGWAALGRVNANLADFGNVAFSGNYSTPYWGSIEKRVSERQRETIIGWDGSSSFQLGKFFPEKWGIQLPLFLGYSESFINPQFDPLNPDILFQMSAADMTPEQKAAYKQKSQNYTRRRSMNFTNVRKEKSKTSTKPMPWDI
jgi:cell surface protein SprA